MTPESNDQRGSRKLLEERLGTRAEISPEDITQLLDALDMPDVEVLQILTKGVTPVVDTVIGGARVSIDRLGEFVTILARLGFNTDVFPFGTPNPEGALARFER